MKPFRCPICNGTGLVPGGFYLSSIGGAGTACSSSEPCKQCGGTGIIWGQDDSDTCSITECRSVVASDEPKLDLEQEVTDILHKLGIPAHIKGFSFLREAIILSVNDEDYIQHITKALYPTLARDNKTTPSRVERAIRHAIEVGFSRGDVDTLNSMFSFSCNKCAGKATNSEFIATIADSIRLRRK